MASNKAFLGVASVPPSDGK